MGISFFCLCIVIIINVITFIVWTKRSSFFNEVAGENTLFDTSLTESLSTKSNIDSVASIIGK